MSKKKKMMAVEVVGELENEREADQEHDFEDEAMEDAMKDFAEGERVVKLYRYPNELTGGRPRFMGPLAREEFNEVNVQARFGGGRYFGRWKRKDGKYQRFTFDIDGEPKVMTRAAEEYFRQQQDREENPYGFLKGGKTETEESDQGIGTADILKIIAETRRESREEMRMLLELMRPNQQQPDATEKVFSLVEKIVPLISQGGGDGSGGNPWLFALSQLKEPLMKMVDTIHTAVTKPQPQPAPTAPVPTGKRIEHPPKPEPTPAEPEPEPKSEDDMLVESFKPYLGMLVKAATESKDPSLYCDLILDQIPSFAYDRLRVWLLKPGCLDDLAKLDGAIFNQRGWWEALRGLLLEALNEELGHGVRSVQPLKDSDASEANPTDSPLIS